MEKKTIAQLIEAEIEKVFFAENMSPSSIRLYSDLGKMIVTNVAVNYLHEQTKDMTHDACIESPVTEETALDLSKGVIKSDYYKGIDIQPIPSHGKILKECKDEVAQNYCKVNWNELMNIGKAHLVDHVAELYAQSQQVTDRWVKVSTETMPTKPGYYLGVDSTSNNRIVVAECYENIDGLKFQSYITHWMPLPSPPLKG